MISGSRNLEVRETRHLYLLQTKLAGPIRAWLSTQTDFPQLRPLDRATNTSTRA